MLSVADRDLEIRRGGGRVGDRPRDKGPGLKKLLFRPLEPQFGLKIKGGGGGPLMDPPLVMSDSISKSCNPLGRHPLDKKTCNGKQ